MVDTRTYDTTALVVSNDPEFPADAFDEVLYYSAEDKTKDLYNLGVKPTEDLYVESKDGKLLFGSEDEAADEKPVRARYVRLYGNSKVNAKGGDNHVVELKVFGKKVPEPAKKYQPYEYDLLCMMAGRAQAIVDNGKYFTSESLAKVEDALKAARKTIATIDADVEAGSYTLTYGDVYKVRAALESAVACAHLSWGGARPGFRAPLFLPSRIDRWYYIQITTAETIDRLPTILNVCRSRRRNCPPHNYGG